MAEDKDHRLPIRTGGIGGGIKSKIEELKVDASFGCTIPVGESAADSSEWIRSTQSSALSPRQGKGVKI